MNSSTITRWERNADPAGSGARGIRLRDAAYIARAFAVDVDEMIYPDAAAIREAREAAEKFRAAQEALDQARSEANKAQAAWNEARVRLLDAHEQLLAVGVSGGVDQEAAANEEGH